MAPPLCEREIIYVLYALVILAWAAFSDFSPNAFGHAVFILGKQMSCQ